MLPGLDTTTGALPPGRYLTTFPELRAVFVDDPMFVQSSSRAAIWDGFDSYLEAWQLAEGALGVRVVLGWWIGGSFVSNKLDPEDIDVTPILNDQLLSDFEGTPGIKKVHKLIQHREGVRDRFLVEPFAMKWRHMPSTLFPETLGQVERQLLAVRGGLDAWWGRSRPPGPKGPAVAPTTFVERGYVEVLR